MERKTIWLISVALAILCLGVFFSYLNNLKMKAQSEAENEQVVRAIAVQFGSKFKMVSLLAPHADVVRSMEDSYAPYVARELLIRWEDYPEYAPGRLTSSPSPDRIEIKAVQTNTDGSFTILGNVVETTSADVAVSRGAKTYPIQMTLENQSGAWLITSFQGYPLIKTTQQ